MLEGKKTLLTPAEVRPLGEAEVMVEFMPLRQSLAAAK